MGESVCLVRSFSQPASREVVPRGVLTESVSFGRFASESLQWEKWSAFTQNRYLEEVERFTKPGSVAQKKAFFEAHFKNRAAGRATQTKTHQIGCVDSLEVSNSVVVPSISVMDNLIDAEVDSVHPSIGEMKVTNVETFNSMAVVPVGEALTQDKSTSLSKERRPTSSGSKTCRTSSKLESSIVIGLHLPLKKTRKETPSPSVPKNQNRSPPEPFSMSINCPPSGNSKKDISEIPQGGSSSMNAKGVGKADKKKKSGPSSVQMSVNFASSARQTSKTAVKNLARKSTTQETTSSNAINSVLGGSKSRKRPLSRTATEGSKAAKCSTSASAVRLSEFPPSNTRLSEDKRKNITGGSKVSCSVQKQPSAGSENLSTHSRTRAKSITVSSPFNFRSDERAEKRKEFFKKVEERNKKEDGVKEQLSSGFKPKQSIHLSSEGCKVNQTSPRFRRNQNSGTEKIKEPHQSFHKVSSIKSINTRNG